MTDPLVRMRRFLRELKRRNVYKVAVTYIVVAFVGLQAVDLLIPATTLPAWTNAFFLALLLLGFPVTLVVAWAFELTPDGLRRTQLPARPDAAEAGVAPEHAAATSWAWPAAVAVLGVLFAAAVFLLVRGWLEEADRRSARAGLSDVRGLVDEGRYREAYPLAVRLAESGDLDTALADVWPRISDRLTVRSDPPGARVVARTSSSSTGQVLGTTPLEDVRVPRAPHLLRIEMEGFAPAERLASSEFLRADPTTGGDGIVIDVELVPEEEAPEGMVPVPGGSYELVTPGLPVGLTARLDDYFIDRHEVSHARFRDFVTSGGYGTRSYWPSPIVSGGDTLAFGEATGRLVDRTGMPAPRGWTGQEPPDDRGDHPVTGVTWYEAAAYCAFRGKRLPTVFQWEKAARDGRITRLEGVVMPWGLVEPGQPGRSRANFAGSGTVPVDAHPFGISPYGAHQMAGNAKEWAANPIGDGRAVTGGSWEDPMYLFTQVGAFDPLFASGSVGFRCARVRADDARRRRDQGSLAIEIDERTPTYEPVDRATFRSLLTHYRYDDRPLEPEVLATVETPDWVRQKVSYEGPADERVLAYLWLPKSTAAPYQTLVYVPGSNVFFSDSVAPDAEHVLGPVVRSGRAMFAVVMKGMVERERGPGYETPESRSVRFRDEMVRHATELRLGLDYLEGRDDIDMDRLAYVSFSFGAGSRLGFAAVDDRYDAAILIGGGIDERQKPALPEVDNVNFAPYIEPPKLLVNSRYDEEHPWYTRALPLWELLAEPKELVLSEQGGHLPPPEVRIPAVTTFLDTIFEPPR